MKNNRFHFALTGALLLGGLMAARPARAEVLTSFSFNDFNFAASDGGIRSSTLATTFPSDSIDNNANGANFDPLAPNRDNALELFSVDGSGANNQGRAVQFVVDTTNYRALVVTLATQNTSNGFNSNAFQYSSDGTTFTTLRTYTPSTSLDPDDAPIFRTERFDFSNITALNNNAGATFRIVFTGGSTMDPGAVNFLDDLTLNGSAIAAVPEPSTWAMVILGVALLGLFGARRQRSDGDATEPSPSPAL